MWTNCKKNKFRFLQRSHFSRYRIYLHVNDGILIYISDAHGKHERGAFSNFCHDTLCTARVKMRNAVACDDLWLRSDCRLSNTRNARKYTEQQLFCQNDTTFCAFAFVILSSLLCHLHWACPLRRLNSKIIAKIALRNQENCLRRNRWKYRSWWVVENFAKEKEIVFSSIKLYIY